MATMQLRTIDPQALAAMSRALVGFDHIFNTPLNNSNYPPHNIVKYSDSKYAIEVAVAGFSKDEITVEVDQDQLVVRGTQVTTDEETSKEYLHRGLASRDFEQSYTLAEYMEVKDAEVKDGMLIISIERIVPEALQPRQIKIK
jgi:molecular chaperone IbpA